MSDFHPVATAIIDFDRVRMIAPTGKERWGKPGIAIFYADGNEDFIPADDPAEEMQSVFRMCAEMNRCCCQRTNE